MHLLQNNNEYILNSARAMIGGKETLVCLTNTQHILMVDMTVAGDKAQVSRVPLAHPANVLRA